MGAGSAVVGVGLNLRPMTDADLPMVAEVEAAAFSHPWSMNVIRGCIKMRYDAWVAELEGVIRGHLFIQCVLDEAHLLNVCVHPTLQGQGFGRQLVAHAEARCEQLGASRIILEVRPSNKPARRLYRDAGFERIGVRPGYYPGQGGREDAWVLSKYL